MNVPMQGREFGDRHAFLARASSLSHREHPSNLAHPLPDAALGMNPIDVGYRKLDAADLRGSFIRNARAALLAVDELDGSQSTVPSDEYLRAHIDANGVRSAVVSDAPLARVVGDRLSALGVSVSGYSRSAAATADLGVSAPVAGVAATGSLLQDSTAEGGRGVSLLPRTHLALLPVSSLVSTTADVLRTFGSYEGGLPANLVLISGPSRTGDIEMILTVGVHGPVKVTVALISEARGA